MYIDKVCIIASIRAGLKGTSLIAKGIRYDIISIAIINLIKSFYKLKQFFY